MSYGLIAHIYPACSRPTSPCPCLAERLCKSVKVQNTFYPGLVAHLLEVLAQLDDRVEGVGRLDRVGVVGDEERLCGLVGDDAFLALWECQCVCMSGVYGRRTFLAFSESSVDSIVMYLSPLTLTPLAMTALVSLLSLNEAAMALISAALSWRLSALMSDTCVQVLSPMRWTYGEVWGRGPGGLAVDIADEGLVDVACADEAVAQVVR
jgi:hypothetical protein